MKRKIFLLLLLCLLVITGNGLTQPAQPGGGTGPATWRSFYERSPFSLDTPIPDCRSLFIGFIQGTWYEMGYQYGERGAKDIANHFEVDWYNRCRNYSRGWGKDKTPEERVAYRGAYLARSWKELAKLSLEFIDFLRGVADGAADELNVAYFADDIPNHLKILYLNESDADLHPNWDFENDRPGPSSSSASLILSMNDNGQENENGCNSLWVGGEATSTGHAYFHGAIHGGRDKSVTQISYVAIPKDPNAQVFWGLNRAGAPFGIGSMANALGVARASVGCPNAPYPDLGLAPGIKDFILSSYANVFSSSAREAVLLYTRGTPEYRALAGRDSVLRWRSAQIMFGDANEGFVVESNANYYFVRTPGYLGEKGSNYIVQSSHFDSTSGSFDAYGNFNPSLSMASMSPDYDKTRFWTGMWFLRNNYGKIDLDMVKEFATAHYGYDEEGNFIDVDPVTGKPTVPDAWSWCTHKNFSEEFPFGADGQQMTHIVDCTTAEVWYVPNYPCHYKEWNMEWQYLDLKPFAEYRRLLWGY